MADYPISSGEIQVKVIKGKDYTFGAVNQAGYADATFDPAGFTGGDTTATVKVQAQGTLTLTIKNDGTNVTDFTGYTFERVSDATGNIVYTAASGVIVPTEASSTVVFNYVPYDTTTPVDVFVKITNTTLGLETVQTISMDSKTKTVDFDTTMTQTITVTDFGYGYNMTGNVTVNEA